MRTLVKIVPLHLFFFLLPGLAWAQPLSRKTLQAEVWILDWDELERMTDHNRAKYLVKLRSIITEFERNSVSGGKVAGRETFWNVVWNAFVPRAEAAPEPTACKAKTPACEDREKYRKDYSGGACIYGGNLSTQGKGRKCKAVRAFKISAVDRPSECAQGQVICNPLVFGFKADNKSPICVGEGREATSRCDQLAPAGNANHWFKANYTGIKESWNEWRAGLKRMCDERGEDPAAARFHCKECGIMMERLFALHTEFRGDLCRELPGYVDETPVVQ